MIVYRIEHPTDGHGPYNPADMSDLNRLMLATSIGTAHADGSTHPSMYVDTAAPHDYDNICAFETIESLDRWFFGWLFDLRAAGYELCMYSVDPADVYCGLRQIVFNRHSARMVDSMSITDLLTLLA